MTALFLGTAAIGRGRPTRRFSMAQSRLRWRFARVQCLDPIIRCLRLDAIYLALAASRR